MRPSNRWNLGQLRLAAIAFVAFLWFAPAAIADGRVALVIGNSEYGAEIGRLKNPVNDARLMTETLQGLGFMVETVIDGNRKAIREAIQGFGRSLRAAGPEAIGLFYYAGHGLQVQGQNFLIPIDADIESEADVEDAAISADYVLRQMEVAGNAVNLVFLDACRNNPMTRGFRSSERGLARIEGPTGSFIGYSTGPGQVAEDGEGQNSTYAAALARELSRGDQDILSAHVAVRSAVMKATGKKQVPWDTSSLTAKVYLAALTPEAPAAAGAAPNIGSDKESLFWESIKSSTDPAEFEAYLDQYPTGTFAKLAEAKIAKLKRAAPAPTQEAAVASETVLGDAIAVEDLDATYVARQSANVRSLPNTDGKVLGKLLEDEAVAVTGKVKDKDWYRVALQDQTGYVNAKLLAEADGEEIAAWSAVKKQPSAAAVQAFLKEYPTGYFKLKADALLASLSAPAPAATQEAAMAPAAPSGGGKPGSVFRDCADCPEMVVVPAGSFTMGSPASEAGRDDNEGPQHNVTIAQPFAVGRFEVTVGEFRQFVSDFGYSVDGGCIGDVDGGAWQASPAIRWDQPGYRGYQQSERDPVVCVSWDDAQAFVRWLSGKTGKQYRLLTEAEWEYAARAGSTSAYSWGDSADSGCGSANGPDQSAARLSWWPPNSRTMSCDDGHAYTAPVGSYKKNNFDLYDMIGNVWEWVEDCYYVTYSGAPSDGGADEGCSESENVRVHRGGAWLVELGQLRFATRGGNFPATRYAVLGFRLARTL